MYVVRDVFKAKVGTAKELVAIFKAATPLLLVKNIKDIRILTDVVNDFWTVIWEFEVENLNDYFDMSNHNDSQVFTVMDRYQDYILEGRREIFQIE